MPRRTIHTDRAPAAIGPYSQAIEHGGWIFLSGQVAIDPESGEMVGGGIAEQTEQVFRNLIAVLEAAGGSLDQVVKTTVFLRDLGDFAEMNEIYARSFGENRPARSTVEVARLPKDAVVEIDVIAVAGPPSV